MNRPNQSKSKFKAKKSLGQNFLIDKNIQDKIIDSCDLTSEDCVLEIGPGKGALTQEIPSRVKKVWAVEKDKLLTDHLIKNYTFSNLEIINDDILKFDFNKLSDGIKVIGNLPYNISTPIVERLLTAKNKFSSIYITVQLEYGQRLVATPNNKVYGSFSCYVQYYSKPEILFKIKRGAFNPTPKVDSCFMRLEPYKTNPYQVKSEELLFKLIRTAFNQRRKTIENSLSTILEKGELVKILTGLGINRKKRAENLTLEDYIAIANA